MQLKIKVIPKASKNAVVGWLSEELKIQVTAPPEKGKANKAVVEVLSQTLGLPKQAVTIVSGHTAARKTLLLEGIDKAELQRRLPNTSLPPAT